MKVDGGVCSSRRKPPQNMQDVKVCDTEALGGAAWTRRAALESAVALLASLSVEATVANGPCFSLGYILTDFVVRGCLRRLQKLWLEWYCGQL